MVTVLAAAALLAGGLVSAGPAAAASTPTGRLERAAQDTHGVLYVAGWAVDRRHPGRSITVDVVADGRVTAHVTANRPRPDIDRRLGITGRHGFVWSATRHRVHLLILIAEPAVRGQPSAIIGTAYLNGYTARTVSRHIIAEAARYVGAAYVMGGSGPGGFDCSGYVAYIYRAEHIATLAHDAETQRHQVRLIAASRARPGDLIFYLSGGRAYHVAVYAGGGTSAFTGYQYAATMPGEGVRYQHIWSNAIQYGTDWH